MWRSFLLILPLCGAALGDEDGGVPPVEAAQDSETPATGFAPRAPVAGMRLVSTRSTLVFEGLPDRPHRLEASYLFPDRARWSLRAIGEDQERAARVMRFRAGARLYSIAPGESQSIELIDREARQGLLQFELRRAAMLWPDGFDWQGDGDRRAVTIEGVGRLTLELGDADAQGVRKPSRFASEFADGVPCERFDALRWNESTRWPDGWELWLGERRVWTETLDEIAHRGDFLDSFFLPPDRRAAKPAKLGEALAHHLDLPRRAVRRRAVEAGSLSVTEAREAARTAADAWRDELAKAGLRLAVEASLELDEQGRPSALLATIDEPPSLPEELAGEALADGPALVQDQEAFGPVAPRRIRALASQRPRGARSGAIELHWDAQGGARLVLPLLPGSS